VFTGLIEEVGTLTHAVARGDVRRVRIAADGVLGGLRVGDSVAVDGVCLTVAARDPSGFEADLGPETLRRTSLGDRAAGHRVNLERAILVGARLGGHVVQGHVDGTGVVSSLRFESESAWLQVTTPLALRRYLVEKGSIAVDGVSLTIAAVGAEGFGVMLIPHTLRATALGHRRTGDHVNLEVDILAKYVEGLLTWNRGDVG
jgi:riboflavin synthase